MCAIRFRRDAKDGILDAAAGAYFTLEACVHIHFHITTGSQRWLSIWKRGGRFLGCCAHFLALLPITRALVSDVRDRSAAMQKMAFWTLPLELTSRWKLVFASTNPLPYL